MDHVDVFLLGLSDILMAGAKGKSVLTKFKKAAAKDTASLKANHKKEIVAIKKKHAATK